MQVYQQIGKCMAFMPLEEVPNTPIHFVLAIDKSLSMSEVVAVRSDSSAPVTRYDVAYELLETVISTLQHDKQENCFVSIIRFGTDAETLCSHAALTNVNVREIVPSSHGKEMTDVSESIAAMRLCALNSKAGERVVFVHVCDGRPTQGERVMEVLNAQMKACVNDIKKKFNTIPFVAAFAISSGSRVELAKALCDATQDDRRMFAKIMDDDLNELAAQVGGLVAASTQGKSALVTTADGVHDVYNIVGALNMHVFDSIPLSIGSNDGDVEIIYQIVPDMDKVLALNDLDSIRCTLEKDIDAMYEIDAGPFLKYPLVLAAIAVFQKKISDVRFAVRCGKDDDDLPSMLSSNSQSSQRVTQSAEGYRRRHQAKYVTRVHPLKRQNADLPRFIRRKRN